jgi:hypothetical protein
MAEYREAFSRSQEALEKLKAAQIKALKCARALRDARDAQLVERLFQESDAANAEWIEAEKEFAAVNEELRELTKPKIRTATHK